MKLSEKTFLVIIVAVILVTSCLLVLSTTILLKNYEQLERTYADNSLERAVRAIDNEIFTLNQLVKDWAPWDDTYAFVEGKKPDYIRTNLIRETFLHQNIHTLVITDHTGKILYEAAYTPVTWEPVPVDPIILTHLVNDGSSGVTGIISLPEGPMIIASQPILHTDSSGPAAGTFLMGRYLDDAEIARIGSLTTPSLTLLPVSSPLVPDDVRSSFLNRGQVMPFITRPLNNTVLAAFAPLTSIDGSPAYAIRLEIPRDIHAQGVSTVFTFILVQLGVGLFIGLIIIVVIDHLVLRRLEQFTKTTEEIEKSGNITKRIEVEGTDELSGLMISVNRMLDRLAAAQNQIQDSETKFRSVIERMQDALYRTDREGNLTMISPSFLKIFGYDSDDEVLNHNIRDLIYLHPEDREEFLRKMNETGSVIDYKFLFRRKDNSPVHITATSHIFYDEHGVPAGIEGILHDDTERRRVEDALRQSESRFRTLAEMLPEIVFEIDLSGRIKFVNRSGLEKTGYSLKDILGPFNILDLLVPEDRARAWERVEQIRHGEQTLGRAYTAQRKDGTTFPVNIYTSAIRQDDIVTGFRGIVIDVSDRVEAEKIIQESSQYLQTLFNSVRAGIVVIDAKTKEIKDVNPAAAALIGIPKKNIVGKECHKFICPSEHGKCPITDLNQTCDNSERILITADGTRIPIIKYVVPVFLQGRLCNLETFIDDRGRQEALKHIQESEARFRELAELLPQFVYEMDTTGRLLFVNQHAVNEFGITHEKLAAGINFRDIMVPEDWPVADQNIQQILSGEKQSNDTYHLRRTDGTIMPSQIFTAPVYREGHLTGFRGLVVDITENLQAQEALKQSEGRFRNLAELLPQIVFELDEMFNFTFYNWSTLEISGYSIDDIPLGTCALDLIKSADRPQLVSFFNDILTSGKHDNREATLINKQGREVPVIVYASPIMKENRPVGVRGVIVDISGQKNLEEALRESETRFRELAELLPQFIFELDENLKFTFYNWSAMGVTGYGYEEFTTGLDVMDIIGAPDKERMNFWFQRILRGEEVPPINYTLIKKEGTRMPALIYGSPIVRNNRYSGIRGVIVDISEQKRLEDALTDANKKLNLMNSVTRHDVLNSITGLLGLIDMLAEITTDDEALALIRDSRHVIVKIKDEILFTRDYQDVGVKAPQWQSLNTNIRNAASAIRLKGVHLSLPDQDYLLLADPLFGRVFYNLIDNSLRHGGSVRTITVETGAGPEGSLIVHYRDDGIGVLPEDKERIFERGVGKNTGFGLFIIREVLGITGATIQEIGKPGQGALFEIRIPPGSFRSGSSSGEL